MSSTTSRAGLYKPATGENVNVVTDLNNNWDAVDLNLNFRTCTSSTRPSVKWDGLTIHETDTRKSYVWNATPAVSGWYQIYTAETGFSSINLSASATGSMSLTSNTTGDSNQRFQVRGDGRVEFGSGSGSTDTFLRRSGAATLTTDGSFVINGTATATGGVSVGGTAAFGGGVGVLGILNATTAPTAAPSNAFVLYGENGRPKLYSDVATAEYMGGAYALSPSSPVVVASTTTETDLGSVTIPANDAVVGSVWMLKAWGQGSTTGTPTLQFKAYLGANQLGATTAFTTATVSNKAWSAECWLVCLGTGGTGSWFGNFTVTESISVSGAAPTTATTRNDGGATVANATTSSNTFKLTGKWGTSSASNTITCRGFIVQRVA